MKNDIVLVRLWRNSKNKTASSLCIRSMDTTTTPVRTSTIWKLMSAGYEDPCLVSVAHVTQSRDLVVVRFIYDHFS